MSVEVSDEIRRNFHLFWDNFPFPVMLLHKDRTIVATNAAAQAVGLPLGRRCIEMGEKKHHAGCLAALALKEQTGKRQVAYIEHMNVVLDSYWIPLAGAEDFYVHFGIDITEYAADRLLPGGESEGAE